MNKIKRALEPVKASTSLKVELKMHLKSKKTFQRKPQYLKWVFSFLILILVFSVVYSRSENNVEAAQLTFEGQVQITLIINEENKVVDINGLNEEGHIVASTIDVKGLEYTQAINEIVNCEAYQKYQQDETSFSVKCHDKNRQNELMEKATKAHHRRQNRHHHR